MAIDYDYSKNLHTVEGPRSALEQIFKNFKPRSLLDVGCGTGTWLKAAMECGVVDVAGIDGSNIDQHELLIPRASFHSWNLTQPIDLKRRFDLAICLEVAEHLDADSAGVLLDSLVRHADVVLFSAACPGQVGQHHVNCQWPGYWQKLFNDRGYACSDEIRWAIWADDRIEPWYRQNVFMAKRDAASAGMEKRLESVIHPAIFQSVHGIVYEACMRQIEEGSMRIKWYLGNMVGVLIRKGKRLLTRTQTCSRS